MAQALHAGDGLKDELGFRATRMPMYPVYLAVFAGFQNGLIFARILQWVIGAIAAGITGYLAASIWNLRTGLIAGLMVAFDPFLIFFSSLLLTETLFITIFLLFWWTLWPIIRSDPRLTPIPLYRWIFPGLTASMCLYIRESTAGVVFVVFVILVMMHRVHGRSIRGTVVAALTIAICLTPWAYRNQKMTGHWCWLTHRAGISLYDGVGPHATGRSDLGDIKNMQAVRGLGEVEWNQYFWDESVKIIRSDPGGVLRLAAIKFARMWNPFPNVETYQSPLIRVISAAWTLPTFVLAVVGAVFLFRAGERGNRNILLWLLIPALYYSAIHSLFIGSIRYRLGAIPMLEMLAAFALVVLLEKRPSGNLDRGSPVAT